MTVGHDDDGAAGRRARGEQRGELGRVEQRAVARDEQHAGRAARGRGPHPRGRGGVERARVAGIGHGGGAVRAGDLRRVRVVGHDERVRDAVGGLQRFEHVGEHRCGESPALAGVELTGEALLGEREALDGDDRERAHATSAASRRIS